MSALKILTQLILKDTIKQKNLMLEFTGQAKKGIASLENLPVLRRDAESKASKLLVDARERGIDLSKLSAEQIKKTYNFSKEVRNQKRMMKTETPKSKDEVSPFMGFKPKIVPKGLSDEVATSQINKLRENLPSMSRNELDQLVKDVINRKAYASFDDAQRKELLKAIEYQTTHKPDFASGGIARVGFSKGKLAKGFFEFVEGLFIKASNDIRQGKGKWAGLDQKQRMVQHDNLTKMVTQWQKTKQLPEGAEQYFGVDAKKVFTQMNEKKDDILKNLTHDFKGKPYKDVAQTIEGTVVDERTLIKTKYPGISDDLLDKILIDDNPQRKADVLSTLDQYLKLRQVGKGEEEAYDIITKSFKKNPTKHASGGIAGELHLHNGGRARFQDGLSAYQSGQNIIGNPHINWAQVWPSTMSQNIIGNPHINMSNELWNRTQLDPNDPNWYDDYEHDYGLPLGSQAERDEAKSNLMQSDIQDEAELTALWDEFEKLDAERNKAFESRFGTNVPGTPIVPTGSGDLAAAQKLADSNNQTVSSLGQDGIGKYYLDEDGGKSYYAGLDATTASTPVAEDKSLYDVVSKAASLDEIAALEAAYNQGKNLPTATGIISDARHQTSLSQLRDTIAKNLAFNPDKPGAISKTVGGIGALGAGVINELGQLVTKPSEAIEDLKSNWQGVTKIPYGQTPEQTYSSVTANYQPQQTTEQIARSSPVMERMAAAKARGYDERMGRTYAENIQAMADPRMRGAKGGLAKILGV